MIEKEKNDSVTKTKSRTVNICFTIAIRAILSTFVKNNIQMTGVFRTVSKLYDRAFLLFRKKVPSEMFDKVLNTQITLEHTGKRKAGKIFFVCRAIIKLNKKCYVL